MSVEMKSDWSHSELREFAIEFMDGCDQRELEDLSRLAKAKADVIEFTAHVRHTDEEPF